MHTRGATNKVKGRVEAGLGKLTGNKRLEAKGKARQVQGSAQEGLGDIRDTLERHAG